MVGLYGSHEYLHLSQVVDVCLHYLRHVSAQLVHVHLILRLDGMQLRLRLSIILLLVICLVVSASTCCSFSPSGTFLTWALQASRSNRFIINERRSLYSTLHHFTSLLCHITNVFLMSTSRNAFSGVMTSERTLFSSLLSDVPILFSTTPQRTR